MKKIFLLLCITGTMLSCTKDEHAAGPEQEAGYGNRIKFVLQDNLDFNVVTGCLSFAGTLDSLAMPGPFTFLAPNNAAFMPYGVYLDPVPATFYFFTSQKMKSLLQYHTLKGSISFAALPVDTDTAFVTIRNKHVYVKKFLTGIDTIITVNGVKMQKADIYASNGAVSAIVDVMNEEVYPRISDCVHDNVNLTMFNVAMQRTGLDTTLLSGTTPYTVLAPSNDAFIASAGSAFDLSTIDKIMKADKDRLAALLRYHLLPGRFYQDDLYRAATVTMLNNEQVTISGYAPAHNNINFTGIGNGAAATIYVQKLYNPSINNADITCGNGVVFIITSLLIP